MITREMIQNGFDNGSISIEDEFGGCISLCCRIADNAFYFAGMEDGDLTAEENGLDSTELDYYESVLS